MAEPQCFVKELNSLLFEINSVEKRNVVYERYFLLFLLNRNSDGKTEKSENHFIEVLPSCRKVSTHIRWVEIKLLVLVTQELRSRRNVYFFGEFERFQRIIF